MLAKIRREKTGLRDGETLFFFTSPIGCGDAVLCPWKEYDLDTLIRLAPQGRVYLANAEAADDVISYSSRGDSRLEETLVKYENSFRQLLSLSDFPQFEAEEHSVSWGYDEKRFIIYRPFLPEIIIPVPRNSELYEYIMSQPLRKWDEILKYIEAGRVPVEDVQWGEQKQANAQRR